MRLTLDSSMNMQSADHLLKRLAGMGLSGYVLRDNQPLALHVTAGCDGQVAISAFDALPGVTQVEHLNSPFKLTDRALVGKTKPVMVGHHAIGGDSLTVMAGPCSVESEIQIHRIAQSVSQAGAQFLRGGAYKPRTSPYDFQGLGRVGIDYLSSAAKDNGLFSVTEIIDPNDIEYALDKIDMFQVGARNMQNYQLLRALGQTRTPILLKRGMTSTYKEWLLAAEYILSEGNASVVLCERGIRTFETQTRNTLDLNAVPMMKQLTHLPVVVDPSHGTGLRELVMPMACAGVAAGADGVIIEVHHDPERSVSDARQAVSCEDFKARLPRLFAMQSIDN